MRTRYLLLLLVPALLLLALGALPALIGGEEAHVVVATAVDVSDDQGTVDAANLSERRFPYTTQALEEGRSDVYRGGPGGFKGAFTHSPFDERSELRTWNPEAADDEAVYVERSGTVYRVEIERTDESDE